MARDEAEDLASAQRTAAELHRVAESEERRLRQLWRDTQAELARVRETLTVIERQARETESKLAAIGEARNRIGRCAGGNCTEAGGDGSGARRVAGERRARARACRSRAGDGGAARSRRRCTGVGGEPGARTADQDRTAGGAQRRARALADAWCRCRSADRHPQRAQDRSRDANLPTLADLPALVETQRGKIMSELSAAEQARRDGSRCACSGRHRTPRGAEGVARCADRPCRRARGAGP